MQVSVCMFQLDVGWFVECSGEEICDFLCVNSVGNGGYIKIKDEKRERE